MVIMLLFMGCSSTLFELQKEGKNTGFNYKTKSQMSWNVSILKFYRVVKSYYMIEFQYGHIPRRL